MKTTIFFLLIIFLFSCTQKNNKNCYQNTAVVKTKILIADTALINQAFGPNGDTTKIYQVFNGIGFVNLNGIPIHKPLKEITLSENQQEEFLKILRPTTNQDLQTSTSCIPIFRHVVLFYDSANLLIGQMQICFDCHQVRFNPGSKCLNAFDDQRIVELENFFKQQNIPLFDNSQ